VLAYRALALMPIHAWYASGERNATKPFLRASLECLHTLLHTVYQGFTVMMAARSRNATREISFASKMRCCCIIHASSSK
jgi:hypothetical protein